MIELEKSGRAVIEDGAIVIRIALEALPMIVEGSWAAGYMDTRYKVTNTAEFSSDLVHELNDESEDGTTRIHLMFDKAIENAIEQGAFGIEKHEKQEV